jgi:hypothetical protein
MGDALKQEVKLPIWMIGLILSLLIAIFSYSVVFGGTSKATELNTKQIEILQATKADKEDMDKVYNKLEKIEGLLIDHMKEKSTK